MASYTTASLAIPLLAKILPAWRSMKMIAVFPNLLVIGAYFVGWIPESLSWLICKNQMDKARTALVNVAKINQKDLEVCHQLVAYKKCIIPIYIPLFIIFIDIFEHWCNPFL